MDVAFTTDRQKNKYLNGVKNNEPERTNVK